MALVSGQLVNNRFRVAAQIEKRAFGAVFRGWDLQEKRACLVEEITEMYPGGLARLQQLVQTLKIVRHPHLQKVIDFTAVPGGGMYVVMEYLEGESLEMIQEKQARVIEEKQAVKWMAQVCGALDSLHKMVPPIIHGAVQPRNIIIDKQGNAFLANVPEAMVLTGSRLSGTVTPSFSREYSAPEWEAGQDIDGRSDIYSLGLVLYGMLTGLPPQPAAERIKMDSCVAADTVNTSVSPGVARALEHAMSLNPETRFFNAIAFRNALLAGAGLKADELPAAPLSESSGDYRNRPAAAGVPVKKKRKWLGWVIAGGVISLAVIAGLVLFVVGIGKDFPGVLGLHPTETAQKKAEKTKKPEKDIVTEEPAAATKEMPATEEPAIIITEEPAASIQLEIWHSYTDTAGAAFTGIIDSFTRQHPEISIEQTYVYYEDWDSRFDIAMSSGDGPTMIITAGDGRGARYYEEGIVKDISAAISPDVLARINGPAQELVSYKNGMIGVPFTINGVLLYRNKSIIPEAPSNWDDLIAKAQAATAGKTQGMIFESALFFSAGHLYALGGQLMDPYTGEPRFLDDYGVAWLNHMQTVRDAGIPITNYQDEDQGGFKNGTVGMIIDGGWNASSFADAIGTDNLVIDPWPEGMSGFVTSEVVYLVNNGPLDAREDQASLEFMEYLVSEPAQMIWAEVACSNQNIGVGVPVLRDLYVSDPLLTMAMNAFAGGVNFPVQPNMDLYWNPLNTAINDVIYANSDPWDALQVANDVIISQLP